MPGWEALKARVWEALASIRWRWYRFRNPLYTDAQLAELELSAYRDRRRLAAGLSLGIVPLLAMAAALLLLEGDRSGSTATAKSSADRVAVGEVIAPDRLIPPRPGSQAKPGDAERKRGGLSASRRSSYGSRSSATGRRSRIARRGHAPRRVGAAPPVFPSPGAPARPIRGRPHGQRKSGGGGKERKRHRGRRPAAPHRGGTPGALPAPSAPAPAPEQPAAGPSPAPPQGDSGTQPSPKPKPKPQPRPDGDDDDDDGHGGGGGWNDDDDDHHGGGGWDDDDDHDD
jgi:hypothetical protein